jgi:glycosyltransferase involved in cell wall biosynthesis
MRVGLVTGEYPPMQGGIGAHCQVLAGALTAQGHTVRIFTDPRGDDDRPEVALAHRPGERWRWRALRAIDAWARRESLDVVNLHYQTAAYAMSPWIHALPDLVRAAPVVTTFHDLRHPYLFPKAGRLRDWIVLRLARASAGVITTNHEDAGVLAARLAHRPSPRALIPIGSSVPAELPADFDRAAWRKRASADAGEILVAHFGFINHSKGVDTLLNAAAMLIAAGVRLRLVMLGGRTGTSDPSNAAYAIQIDAQVEALGLTPYLCWTGFVEAREVSAWLAAADLIALPFRDGASYRRSSLMAAVAHGGAVLTTKPSVDIPTFQNGANLLMVAPDNVPALAAALQVAANDPALRDHLRAGARALRATFAWEQIASQHVTFFQEVIDTWR